MRSALRAPGKWNARCCRAASVRCWAEPALQSPAHLVVLAPVHVGTAGHASRVQHMSGLDLRAATEQRGGDDDTGTCSRHMPDTRAHMPLRPPCCWHAEQLHLACQSPTTAVPHPLKVGEDGRAVLQAGGGKLKLGALLLQQLSQQAACRGGTDDSVTVRLGAGGVQGVQQAEPVQLGRAPARRAPCTHRSSRTCRRSERPAGAARTGKAGFG